MDGNAASDHTGFDATYCEVKLWLKWLNINKCFSRGILKNKVTVRQTSEVIQSQWKAGENAPMPAFLVSRSAFLPQSRALNMRKHFG